MTAARTVAAWLLVVPWLAWAVVRFAGLERGYPLMPLIAFTPYAAAAALVSAGVAALLRRPLPAVAALAVALALGLAILPRAAGGPSDAEGAQGPRVRVLTVNLRRGGADPRAVVALVRGTGADVLALEEVDRPALDRLDAAGLSAILPHRVVELGDGFHGTALLARAELAPLPPVRGVVTPMARATADLPGAPPLELVAVHAMAPQDSGRVRGWKHDLRALPAAGGGLRVLAGDFNATLDHAELRRLLGTGYEDAAEQVGAGLQPTWPVGGRRRLPVTIDHVLAGERAGVRRVATHKLPRTDHRAFLAELVLPAE